jgi:hypothetical protein
MITVGKLKKIIENMPDDAPVLQVDPFSEYAYDIKDMSYGRSKIVLITKKRKRFYNSWKDKDFNNFLDDNPDEKEQINKEYTPSLLLYIG